jgi:hypothetical protein
MATINAISVALFNAAAGGYTSEMTTNGAALANAVGPILEKDISSNALFVEHLLANFGIPSTNAVYKEAQAALTGMVTAKGRLGAATDAVDYLKTQEGTNSPFAAVANAFAVKVAAATAYSSANPNERDITKLISAVTGVDTDVAATNAAVTAAVAAQKATDDAALAAAVKTVTDAAAAAKTVADAAIAKAATDLKTAQDRLAAVDNTIYATEQAAADAAKAAAEMVAKNAADLAALRAENDLVAAKNAADLAALKAAGDLAAAKNAADLAALKAANDLKSAQDAATAAKTAADLAAAKAAADIKALQDAATAAKTAADAAAAKAATDLQAAQAKLAAVDDTTFASEKAAADAATLAAQGVAKAEAQLAAIQAANDLKNAQAAAELAAFQAKVASDTALSKAAADLKDAQTAAATAKTAADLAAKNADEALKAAQDKIAAIDNTIYASEQAAADAAKVITDAAALKAAQDLQAAKDAKAAVDYTLSTVDNTKYANEQAAFDAAKSAADLAALEAKFASDALIAKAANDLTAAVAAVDKTTDNAAAVTTALKAYAAAALVVGYETMTDSQLIAAIKTSNDAAIAAAVDITSNDAAVAAAATTAAQAVAAADALVASNAAAAALALAQAQIVALNLQVANLTTTSDFTLTASAATVTEGDTGTKNLTFVLTLDKTPTSAVSINYQTLDTGTASAGDDFEAAAGVVTFAAGQTVATITIAVNGDTSVEVNETVKVQLTGTALKAAVTATGTINENDVAVVEQTTFTVTATQISTNNLITGNNSMSVDVGASGNKTVTLESSGVTADGGFIISGTNANITVNAGTQGDAISVISDGNNTINAGTGTGNDSITVVGTGSNTISVGAGSDTVTGGSGADNVVFTSGALGANDVVDGGAGVDTVTISGDGNVIGGAGATLTNVENLVLQGTTVTVTGAALEDLSSVSGSITTSEITVDVTGGDTLDLSEVSITGIKSITADDDVTIVLTDAQIAQFGSITTAAGQNLTVQTSVAGLLNLGSKAVAGTGGTTSILVSDTAANIQANSAAIAAAGATSVLSSALTVAEAITTLAQATNISYNLSDTAANLALAPEAVFNNALLVTATTTATASQATQIHALITASNATTGAGSDFVAADVTLNVGDTSSNLANYFTESAIDSDAVTASNTSTVDEADDIFAANAAAVYSITDTATALNAAASNTSLDNATSVTVSNAATVAQIGTINAGSSVDVAAGYALTDDYDNIIASSSTEAIANTAGNIVVTDTNDSNISVAEATVINTWANSGTKSYLLEDAIGTLLAANATTVANTSTVQTGSSTVTAAQANALVAKFGAAKVSDSSFVISDTVDNLLTLTAAAVAEAQSSNGITVSSGTGTVAQAVALNTLVGTKLNKTTVAVSDTVANMVSAVGVSTTLTLLDAIQTASGTVTLSDAATVAQAVAINTALAGELTNTYAIADTAALLVAASGGSVAQTNVVGDASTIAITTATTMANVNTVKVASGLSAGTTLTYSISDAAATIIADANTLRAGATTLSITDSSVTGNDAVTLNGYTNFDDVYAINDSYAEILGGSVNSGLTTAILNAATSVTITDTVSNLEASGVLTAIATATTDDALVVSDTLSNLGTSRTSGTAVAAATCIVITDTDLDVSDVTAVNALSVLKTTTYTVSDAYSDLNTAIAATGSGGANETGAVTTFLNNAGTVKVDANADGTLDAISVTQFNTLDAATTSAIRSGITDTIANLTATSGAAALANVIANSNTLTISDTDATVAQIQTLNTAGATVTALNAVDTAANLTAMGSTLLESLNGATVSDNGSVSQNVAALTKIYTADGAQYANYSIVDTAANIDAAITSDAGLVNFASAVTATTNATYTQAGTFASTTTFGTSIAYSVTVAAADAISAGAALNSAINITTSDAQTVADARVINDATNSGTTSYSISDSAASFVSGTASTQTSMASATNNATGTVTVTGTATGAQATVISGFTKAVTYNVSDTAANLALSTVTSAALNEAVAITATGDVATYAAAATLLAATNTGTTTIDSASMTAANAKTLAFTGNDVITTLTVTGTTTAADAATIVALDTGTNITNTIVFGVINGTAQQVAALPDAVLAVATTVNVTDALTVAQYNTLAAAVTIANVDSYAMSDSYSNLMADTDTDGTVNASTAISTATTVTVTDSALTIAQADEIDGLNVGDIVYSIRDRDETIVSALNGNGTTEVALLAASSVYSASGTLLDVQTIGSGSTNVISGTKAEIDALSTILQATDVAYEVSVADLEANPAFYGTLASNEHITVIDTAANLLGGNALLASAEHIVVSGTATVAQATSIRALSSLDNEVVFSLSDTTANLVAAAGVSSIVDAAVNVTATTAATEAQAETIADETNSGTVTYNISAVDTTVTASGSLTGTNAYENATNITITGTTGINSAQAEILLTKANSGTTTLAKVTGTSANLAALTVGTNDVITTVTPSDAATVAQATAMLARAGSISAYSLSDTAANLAAASSTILNGATNIALSSGVATVAQATIIDAATNSGTTTYAIADTAANVLAAGVTVLENDSDDTIVVTDTTVSAATATSLRALDAANNDVVATASITEGFVVNGSATGVFAISDTQANLIATANAAAVAASTAVTVTGNMTVTQAVAVTTATGTVDGSNLLTYNLVDTYTNIVANRSGASALVLTNASVTVSNNINVAQAKVVDAYTTSTTYNIVDTAANVYTSRAHAAVVSATGASTVTLSTAGTVAQAAGITTGTINIVGGYDITDSAANVFSALNTVNTSGGSDRDLLEGADTITLNTDATVAQALGGAANSGDTEARGLYTITGLSYSIYDTVTNMIAGLAGIDAAGISFATSLEASNTTAMTVANASVLTSLSNFAGYDHDTSSLTAGLYYIADGFAALQAADTALIDGATTVAASGTSSDNNIDLSMHSKDMTITGGAGVDTITGGSGSDVFAFATSDIDTTAGAVTDIIQNFSSGDTIDGSFGAASGVGVLVEAGASVADLATLLTAASLELDGTVDYYVGQVTGGDVYVVTDDDGTGYTEVIQLVGVTLATFDGTTTIV